MTHPIPKPNQQAEAKISGEDFSGKKYDSKDFSGAIAQQTNFKMSSFKGARFYKVREGLIDQLIN